jgi:di/tricarboxylate transporter
MDFAVISLIVLVAVIVIAYVSQINIGILALGVAIILSRLGGIRDSDMYSGINMNVFWTLVGIYFFGQCMTQSGTLSLFGKKLIKLLPVNAALWPIICFVFTMAFAFIGPTTILALTVVPLITIEIAGFIGANVECTMILTMFGGIAGRMTPLGGNLAGQIALAKGNGFTEVAELNKIFLANHIIVCIILAIIYYFVFKGFKKSEKQYVTEVEALKDIPKFSKKQWICLICMFGFVIFYAVFQWHIGFVAIICVIIMMATGCVEKKDVIDKTKWGTVVMVAGTGVLASVAQSLGGMDILANAIGYASNLAVVESLYSGLSGILSMFTHAMSVPIPILFATVEETINTLGGSRLDMFRCLAAVGSAAYIGMTCPMSLAGANVFACWTSVVQPDAKTQQKQFGKMMGLSLVSVLLSAVISGIVLHVLL